MPIIESKHGCRVRVHPRKLCCGKVDSHQKRLGIVLDNGTERGPITSSLKLHVILVAQLALDHNRPQRRYWIRLGGRVARGIVGLVAVAGTV